MVIETHRDVVRLSGTLHSNQWLAVKTAASLLLQVHPQGVIIDCAALNIGSEAGAETFRIAMRSIAATEAPILVVNMPEGVRTWLEQEAGEGTRLPIADSVEMARAAQAVFSLTWWDQLCGALCR